MLFIVGRQNASEERKQAHLERQIGSYAVSPKLNGVSVILAEVLYCFAIKLTATMSSLDRDFVRIEKM